MPNSEGAPTSPRQASSVRSPRADPILRTRLGADLDAPPPPRSALIAEALARAFGDSTLALVHYGSHAHSADARPESAPDFFVIVDGYPAAYRSLAATVGTSYRPRLAATLNQVLPPNVIAVPVAVESAVRAKCAVFSLRDFQRACSAPKDHFVQGRLAQHAQLAWSRDAVSRAAVANAIVDVRALSFARNRANLPERFDVEAYCRVLIHTSFAVEIRPERPERIQALLDAQRTTMVPMYADFLRWLADAGILTTDGVTYADATPPGRWSRLRSSWYFRVTKLRSTARWAKYIILYDDWLEYIVQKVARRSGVAIELTARERRWPLVFLWPKAFRFLRSRPQRRTDRGR